MYDRSQLMRGTLEGCILSLLNTQVSYGYEIVTYLQHAGFDELREGTIYPLLLRLEKKEMIRAEYRASPLGPGRKYYALTPAGVRLLAEFTECWQQVSANVNDILNREGVSDENKL